MLYVWLIAVTVGFSHGRDARCEVSSRCDEVDAIVQDINNKYRKEILIIFKL